MVIPITFEVNDACTQHIFYGLDSAFDLTIHLGMKGGNKLNFFTNPTLESLPKMGGKLSASILNDG